MTSKTRSIKADNENREYNNEICSKYHHRISDVNQCCESCHSQPQVSLKSWNTFGLEAFATRISIVKNINALCQCWLESYDCGQPTLLLGEGSNVLFLENFCGHVIINRIKGIHINECPNSWVLHIGAGENWHHLVEHTLQNGMPGLENLALIPRCVGTAPIQNIGAYGVELAKFCEYVDIVCLSDSKMRRLMFEECKFSYRDSVFKHRYREGYAIVAVGLRLPKTWKPELSYGDLKILDPLTVTPQQVFDMVCLIRRRKLPDPKEIGNAGSFFKNPYVNAGTAAKLKSEYPNIPDYPQKTKEVKLAAGWLIDQCGLKGFRVGGAAVHDQQALVLINAGTATGRDVVNLAQAVRGRVADKFDVFLDPEVRLISSHGETDAVKVMEITNNDFTR